MPIPLSRKQISQETMAPHRRYRTPIASPASLASVQRGGHTREIRESIDADTSDPRERSLGLISMCVVTYARIFGQEEPAGGEYGHGFSQLCLPKLPIRRRVLLIRRRRLPRHATAPIAGEHMEVGAVALVEHPAAEGRPLPSAQSSGFLAAFVLPCLDFPTE